MKKLTVVAKVWDGGYRKHFNKYKYHLFLDRSQKLSADIQLRIGRILTYLWKHIMGVGIITSVRSVIIVILRN